MPISSVVWIWENQYSHWFHVERPKMSPLETAVWKLFISVLWLFLVPPVQQTELLVAPLSVTVEVIHPMMWAATPALSTESCTNLSPGWDTAVSQNGSILFLLGLELPFSSSSLPLPPTATTSFLPFDHYKSVCHWHWGGSSDSNDLSFAHIVLFACSAIVPVLFLAFLWLRL